MTRQVTPEEIPAIQIGAIIAYIIVLFSSIWFIQSTVCDIRETKDKLAVLLGIFAVAGIVPWLYTRVIIGQLMQIKRKASLEKKAKYPTVAYLVENLQTLLSQTQPTPEVEGLLEELRRQVDNLATFDKRTEARDQAVKWLKKKWLKKRLRLNKSDIVREAAQIVLDNYNNFSELSRKEKKEVKDGVNKNINECIKFIIYTLQHGTSINPYKLKDSFILEQVQPYIAALEYIRDRKLSEYCKNDLEGEEVRKYIDFLIEDLRV
ncbi:MAG: hypothetical protein F6K26_39365 [Moorea sp. SIO2I5]|nr:hypothetical protein [Moorena sp. SIO2I5]